MHEKIHELEKKVSLLEQEVSRCKENYTKIEHIDAQLQIIKTSMMKLEMIDKSIFDKLDSIAKSVEAHKDNFIKHDEEEMKKYAGIDARLLKLERILYAFMGGFIVLETLHKFKILSFG